MGERRPWSPLKAALVAFGLTLAIGLVVSLVLASLTGALERDSYGHGKRVGDALAPFAIGVGVLTYFIVRARRR